MRVTGFGEHLTEKPGQGEDRSRHPDEGVYLAEEERMRGTVPM